MNRRPDSSLPAPLSFGQEVLWLLDQASDALIAYNVPRGFRVEGRLDVSALQQALDLLAARHEILRTSFADPGTGPVQRVDAARAVPLEVVELAPGADEALLGEEITARARRRFDLHGDLLLRATLLRTGGDDAALLLETHHIATDGWSKGIMLRELGALYAAIRDGHAPVLPPLPVQYADFAAWQREQARRGAYDEDLAWWTGTLAGAPPALELPTDRPRPTGGSFRGARHTVRLPDAVRDAVQELGRSHRCTPFMTLLAAWQALLHRYSGQLDVVTGCPVAGRDEPALEGLIGYFTNTVALRTSFEGDPTFAELLARVRAGTLDAWEHQQVPFERLAGELHRGASAGRPALYQVLFQMEREDAEPIRLGDAVLTPIVFDPGWTKLDLSLGALESDSGLSLQLQYRTELFDAATIVRMLSHLQQLLLAAARNPATPVSRLPLLGPEERRQVVTEWNATAREYESGLTLTELLERQARRTPDAEAVRFEDRALSYQELHTRANRLAHRLQRLGVGPDRLVGVCAERSLEMVVALLGILKAGGAYVPLDPEYPEERLAFMLADAAPAVLLTQDALLGRLPPFGGITISLDSDDGSPMESEPVDPPPAAAGPANLAYMIYTSGSTGRPKGALNEHRGIVNRLLWMQDQLGLTPADTVLQKTPFSFDVSVWEFFWPLVTGARLVLAEPGGHRDPAYLSELIGRERVTVLHFVPSMLRAFLAGADAGDCASLREVVCSGEALPADLAALALDRLPARLTNLYGPTEAAVDVTCWTCEPGSSRAAIPIGRPIANTRTYILDRHGEPVPIGVPGELYLGGVQVGRGYWNRPELTAEKFVPDPFAASPGARLYRTGDLARWLPDGAIDFLGRLDFQVKLRGFRIELGEIETALSTQPEVSAAVVVVHGADAEARLVAYVVARSDATIDRSLLRERLSSALPPYMIPDFVVVLPELPLSPNGKLDRRALPAPDAGEAGRPVYAEPGSPLERRLAALWGAVLGGDRIGKYDDFFQLGGHSLLAMRVLARLRAEDGVRVTFAEFLASPTLSALAVLVAARAPEPLMRSPIPVSEPTREFGLSSQQALIWLAESIRPGQVAYNAPYLCRLTGPLDADALQRALDELVLRHDALRTGFEAGDEEGVQRVLPARPVPMERVLLAEPAAWKLLRTRAERPFDLGKDLLLRATVVGIEPEVHLLLLETHHLVSDGWSYQIMLQELSALYRPQGAKAGAPLPPVTRQYRDYVAWQRAALDGGELGDQLAWWRETLEGSPELLDLPIDRGRPAEHSFEGGKHVVVLPLGVLEGVRALARTAHATPFAVVLAAFKVLLSRLAGTNDILVATPVAARIRPELDGMVGFVANTLVLRTDLSGDPSFAELIGRVSRTAAEALDRQEVPFERIALELGMTTGGAFSQVMFSYQSEAAPPLGLAGLAVQEQELERGSAKNELFLSVQERADGLRAAIEFRTDLFDPATIERIHRSLRSLVEAAIAAPERPISRLLAGDSLPTGQSRPSQAPAAPAGAATAAVPATPVEAAIARVWSEVLKRRRVETNQSFFEIGGHSLLATQVVGRLAKLFRMRIPLRTFFAAPTISALAKALVEIEPKPGQVTTIGMLLAQIEAMPEAERRARETRDVPAGTAGVP